MFSQNFKKKKTSKSVVNTLCSELYYNKNVKWTIYKENRWILAQFWKFLSMIHWPIAFEMVGKYFTLRVCGRAKSFTPWPTNTTEKQWDWVPKISFVNISAMIYRPPISTLPQSSTIFQRGQPGNQSFKTLSFGRKFKTWTIAHTQDKSF